MILEFIGTLEIEKGLTLGNPKMEIVNVHYNLKTDEFNIEVHFWETKAIHSRSFGFTNPSPGSLSMSTIMSFINTHDKLKLFNTVQ